MYSWKGWKTIDMEDKGALKSGILEEGNKNNGTENKIFKGTIWRNIPETKELNLQIE